MKRGRRIQYSAGISLLELMIGLFIFTVSFLGIVGVYPTSLRAVQQGKEMLVGLNLAEEAMEKALARIERQPDGTEAIVTFDNLDSSGIINIPMQAKINGTNQVMTYSVQTLISPDPPGSTERKLIRVQVSWQEGSVPRLITLESLLHRP